MAKIGFLVLFLVGSIFTVSHSFIFNLPSISLDPVLESKEVKIPYQLPEEGGLNNNLDKIDQIGNEHRHKRSPQLSLPNVLGSIGRILNVTSSLSNAFNTTIQSLKRLRDLSKRICFDCRNKSSPVVAPSSEYYYYDNYYDYAEFGRRKREVDSSKSEKAIDDGSQNKTDIKDEQEDNAGSGDDKNSTTSSERPKRLVAVPSVLENFIRIEIMRLLQNVKTVVKQQISLISARAKIEAKKIFDSVGLFFGLNKESKSVLPDKVKRQAPINEGSTSLERIPDTDDGGIATDEYNPLDTVIFIIIDTMSQIVTTLREFASTFFESIRNPEISKRDIISVFDLSDYLFNFLDRLGRKRRSVGADLLTSNDLGPSQIRTKRFAGGLLDLGEEQAENLINFLEKSALDKLDGLLELLFNYLNNYRFISKRSLSSSEKVTPLKFTRFKRGISDVVSSIRNGIKNAASRFTEAIRNVFNRGKELAESDRKAISPVESTTVKNGEPTPAKINRLKRGISDVLKSGYDRIQDAASRTIEAAKNGYYVARYVLDSVVKAFLKNGQKTEVNTADG